nr:MAG TPA: hypothetical protein [Caudoviricetes sp.]
MSIFYRRKLSILWFLLPHLNQLLGRPRHLSEEGFCFFQQSL